MTIRAGIREPIILLGFQRSGTTAFGHVLAKAMRADGGLFTVNGKLLYYLRRWITASDVDAMHLRFDEIMHALQRVPPTQPESAAWLKRTAKALGHAAEGAWRDPAAHADATKLARRIVETSYGGWARWGEKYNEEMLDVPYLERVLTRPKYLFLYRHPAMVAQSMLKWSKDKLWNPRTLEMAVEKWWRWNARAAETLAILPRDRVFVAQYGAKLVSGYARERLQAFLDLPLPDHAFEEFRMRPEAGTPAATPSAKAMALYKRLNGRDGLIDAPAVNSQGDPS